MSKSKISLYFIFIAIFTFLAIFLTIVQASYNNLINPIKQVEADKYLEPLNPILDSEIIQEIEKRPGLNENDEIMINNSFEISPTPTPNDNIQPISTTEENI